MRKGVVCGAGNPKAKVMFIGIAPGKDEDRLGQPFVGDSGKWLMRALKYLGLKRGEVYLTNIVKCRPYSGHRNRDPHADEIEACSQWLEKELKLVNPQLVVLLGGMPLQIILGLDGIMDKRGRFYFRKNDPRGYFPLLHPAVLVRDKESYLGLYKDDLWELRRVLRRMKLVRRRKKRSSKGSTS